MAKSAFSSTEFTDLTVFYAHTHFLPFNHAPEEVIPDVRALRTIGNMQEIADEYAEKHKYLFFECKNRKMFVDTRLGYPRFFRDIFAELLGSAERGNWKKASEDSVLSAQFQKDILKLSQDWRALGEKRS